RLSVLVQVPAVHDRGRAPRSHRDRAGGPGRPVVRCDQSSAQRRSRQARDVPDGRDRAGPLHVRLRPPDRAFLRARERARRCAAGPVVLQADDLPSAREAARCALTHRAAAPTTVKEVAMAIERTATGIWRGTLKEGSGTITSTSDVLRDVPFSFATRFEN